MLTNSQSVQAFGYTKYNLADYNRYRNASNPVAYYNDNSKRKSIANLAEIFLSGEADEFKKSESSKKKSKFGLFQKIDDFSQLIAKTYNVFVAQKLNKYRELADKIL